jgi:hypothetical protein
MSGCGGDGGAAWRRGKVDPVRFIDRPSELGCRASPQAPFAPEPPLVNDNYTLPRCLAVAVFAALKVVLLSSPRRSAMQPISRRSSAISSTGYQR